MKLSEIKTKRCTRCKEEKPISEFSKDKSKNSSTFVKMFNIFIESGRKRSLAPSYDRINDDKPYTEDNIQLMTFGENLKKSHDDMRSGKLIHGANPQRAVVRLTKDSIFVDEFVSSCEADRQTGIYQQNIGKVCRGIRNYAGGFIYKFKEDYNA